MLPTLINKLVLIYYGLTYGIRYAPLLQRINRAAWRVDKVKIATNWLLANRCASL